MSFRPIATPKKTVEGVEPGAAPILDWIDIERLVIDDTYQRPLKQGNWAAIGRIASGFSWSRFSPVFVAPVEGGLFAVIDGQHRVHAAAACGIARVPCQIVQMTRSEQAAAFAAVNGAVTKVTAWQVFKASLTAGEAWAVEVNDTATDAGCQMMTNNQSSWTKKPGIIFGVRSMRDLIAQHGRANVTVALKRLMAAEGYRDTAEIWDMSVLYPLVAASAMRPEAMAQERAFVVFLEAMPIWDIIEAVSTETKARIRVGLPYALKKDNLTGRILDRIDDAFATARAGRSTGARHA